MYFWILSKSLNDFLLSGLSNFDGVNFDRVYYFDGVNFDGVYYFDGVYFDSLLQQHPKVNKFFKSQKQSI